MDGVKKSRSLRIYAEDSDPEEQLRLSRSARRSGEQARGQQRSSFSGRRSSHELHEDDAKIENGVQGAGSERYFDVEISGAVNALGSFRHESQRVYVSQLPDSLQDQIARDSVLNSVEGDQQQQELKKLSLHEDQNQGGENMDFGTKSYDTESGGKKSKNKATVVRQSVPYLSLFKYADKVDYLLMILGTSMAVLDGLMWPSIAFIQSRLLNQFASLSRSDPERAYEKVCSYALILVYVAIVSMVASYFEVWCWMYTGERQAGRIRAKYVRAILRQNVGHFDTQSSNMAAVVSSVSSDTLLLQDAISEKVGNTVQNVALLVGGVIVGATLCWRLALSILPFLPFLLLPGLMYGRALLGLAVRIQVAYGKAGILAEQAISSVRTVYSFVGEKRTLEAFGESLESTVNLGKKQGLAKGLAIGLTAQTFLIWAFVCWYGTYQVIHGLASGGSVVFCAFIILYAGLGLGSVTPNIKCFLEGRVAAYRIFQLIDRVPPIDVENLSGKTLEKVNGNLELRNIDFAYPSRMDAPIFKNFSIHIPAGKTIALVGNSGSGKSTVVALLERFYDPLAGQVLIDGVDIKDLQLKWLRRQIGLVSQEPALFATSIVENIRYGKDGATMEEVIEAAKSANAHSFISQMPNGYNTQVGERGVQMSGGQKQRIAIARTIIKAPSILLLDEATSALDTESEKVVQQALEKAAVGRTTVVVAHRLSTIRNADLIAVLQHGKVVEMGSHEELVKKGEAGAYFALINLQNRRQDEAAGALIPTNEPMEKEEATRASYEIPSKRISNSDQEEVVDVQRDRQSDQKRVTPLEPDNKMGKPSFRRMLWLNKPEWKQGLLGVLGAIGFGFTNPFYAYIIALLTIDYYENLSNAKLWSNIHEYIGILIGLAFFFLGTNVLQHYNFAHAGEKLTKRVREQMLNSMLQFEVGWFDRDENSSGSVCSRLSSDANMVRSLIGDRISLITGSLSMVIISWIICFIVSWRFGLLIIFLHPIIIFCYYIKKALLMTFAKSTALAQSEASQVASEAVAQHRTVTAFSAQEKVQALFEQKLEIPRRQMLRRSQIAGVTLGVANFCSFGSMALVYWYGGLLSRKGLASFSEFFRVFLVFVNTSRTIGEAGALTPDIAKASIAINAVFHILDRKTKIQSNVVEAEVVQKVEGHIQLKDVYFAYPSRPDIMVFRGFSLTIQSGQTVAMVGQSGSGKSTIIGLIERFYDPLKGTVLIDGKDLTTVNVQSMRQHIGLVSQEPTLFALSIRDNIAYGKEGATETEILEAARAANAHNFISSLPEGYSTFAGDRGLQLSGGQKQRIAIARAILKNPKILLLDEATSALDAESERVVQDALDDMVVGRTTIVVAHRLSTIRNADTIAVLQEGVILEQGRHNDLLAKGEGGAYYSLVHSQAVMH